MAKKYIYKLFPKWEGKHYLKATIHMNGGKEIVNLVGEDYLKTVKDKRSGKEKTVTHKKGTPKHWEAFYNQNLRADGTSAQKVVQRIEVNGTE